MKYLGAIFDVDGVLVDSPHERAWRESLQRLMQGAWRELAPQTSYTPDRFTTAVYQEYVAGKPRMAGAKAALDFFGVPDMDGSRAREYAATKQEYLLKLVEAGEFTAFDDALRLVLRLRAAGLKLGVASSSKNANMFLQRVPIGRFAARERERNAIGGDMDASVDTGMDIETVDHSALATLHIPADATLLDVFDANVSGRDFAHGKPDPEMFLACAAELGLPPEQCLVVEDAQSGVQAAKAGGMAAIGIARFGDEALLRAAHADYVVTSLDDIDVDALLEDE